METPPKPTVKLLGEDGNAFAIMGKVAIALKKAGFSEEHIDEYYEESSSGDYDNLIRVAMKYANVY